MVEPITRSGLKKILVSSARLGSAPEVVPLSTSVPPGRSALIECDQVAAPTVSITASTRSGSRAPDAKARRAPRARPPARPAPDRREVTQTRSPAWRAEHDQRGRDPATGALDQHGLSRAAAPAAMNSIRYAVSQAVGRQAASAKRQLGRLVDQIRRRHPDPLGERPRVALRQQRPGRDRSVASEPVKSGSLITAYTITSRPSAVTPAASQPRIIGSRSAGSPTPRSDQTSW